MVSSRSTSTDLPSTFFFSIFGTTRPPIRSMSLRRSSGSPGSGSSVAISALDTPLAVAAPARCAASRYARAGHSSHARNPATPASAETPAR